MNPPSVLTVPVDLGGIWHYGWAIGLIGLVLMLLKPSISTALGWYFLSRAIWIIEAPLLPFGDYTRAFQASAGAAATEMLLVFFSAVFLFYYGRPKWLKYWQSGLVVIECAMVWAFHAGLLGWQSFDCALIALCLPQVRPRWLWLLALATILTHHGSTAFAILLIQVLVFEPEYFGFAAMGFFVLAFYYSTGPLFDGLERLHAWHRYMKFWASDWHQVVFGTGPGSFMWISLLIDKFQPPLFLQMHNDWLQILFEEGVIGFGLVASAFSSVVWNTRKNKRILAQVLSVGVFALTYHPLRFFPSAFVIAMIFCEALRFEVSP